MLDVLKRADPPAPAPDPDPDDDDNLQLIKIIIDDPDDPVQLPNTPFPSIPVTPD